MKAIIIFFFWPIFSHFIWKWLLVQLCNYGYFKGHPLFIGLLSKQGHLWLQQTVRSMCCASHHLKTSFSVFISSKIFHLAWVSLGKAIGTWGRGQERAWVCRKLAHVSLCLLCATQVHQVRLQPSFPIKAIFFLNWVENVVKGMNFATTVHGNDSTPYHPTE